MLDVGLAIGGFVLAILALIWGVVSWVISRRDFRARLRRRDELRATTTKLFIDRAGQLPEVTLVNAATYEKHYDGGNWPTRHGFLQLRAELVDARQDGIEFLEQARSTFQTSDGLLTLDTTSTPGPTVLEVGFVPYEWVEHIKPDGDEFKGAPIFVVRFKGPGRSPFKYHTYREDRGTQLGPTGRLYYQAESRLPDRREPRLRAWMNYRAQAAQWRRNEARTPRP